METFRCEPFGTITVRRRHGAKNIRIRIEAEGLTISADFYTSCDDIVRLIEENRDKIIEKQEALKASKKIINEESCIKNGLFTLSIRRDDSITKSLFVLKAESNSIPYSFVMHCNCDINFNDGRTQELMLDAINKMIRNIAKEPLKERTMQLAGELGFEVSSVRTKMERSKWGSCSSRRNINLSAYLILLPDHLKDFVIIHELCHLKEMNHSKRFHDLVNKYTGGREKELEKELKRYSINLYDYTQQADV